MIPAPFNSSNMYVSVELVATEAWIMDKRQWAVGSRPDF